MENFFLVSINGHVTLLNEKQLNSLINDSGYLNVDLPENNLEVITEEGLLSLYRKHNIENGVLYFKHYCGYETVTLQDITGVCESAILISTNFVPITLQPGGPIYNSVDLTHLQFNPSVSFTNRSFYVAAGLNVMTEDVIEGQTIRFLNEDGTETLIPNPNGFEICGKEIQVIQVEENSIITVPANATLARPKKTHFLLYTVKGEKRTVSFECSLADFNKASITRNIRKACHQALEFSSDLTAVVVPDRPSQLYLREDIEESQSLSRRITVLVEPDKFNQEMSEVCSFCKFPTPDPEVCQRCRRNLVNKETSDTEKEDISSPEKVNKKKKCTKKVKKSEELECVTISSDEDDVSSRDDFSNGSTFQEPTTSVFEKEPIITADTEGSDNCSDSLRGGGIEMESLMDNTDIERATLNCRTVRFGTYKVAPEDKIVVTEHGLRIKVPSLSKHNSTTVIKILMKDIVKVLIHFGISTSTAPTMFYYVTHEASKKIREALHMSSKNKSHYFDPTSKEELHKRITLLPEKITEEERLFIRSIYESRCLMEEITWDEANDILVRAAPKDIQQDLKKEKHNMKSIASTSQSSSSSGIQIIMVYPPPPAKGGISINTEDYACLKEDQFLNDVIIDFYLKYLWLNLLSEEDRKRTHIFSSFFYKRLTMCTPRQTGGNQEGPKLSPAEKRHARVKGWTKSVDIFEKDFIIIPINERSHWFLGIICFPGLTGPVRMSDNQAVPNVVRKKCDASVLAGGLTPAKIYGTTITVVQKEKINIPKAPTISLLDPDEERDGESDRDEAEADDDDMEPNTTDEESGKDDDLMDEATPRVSSKSKPQLDPVKQPCILIFDSLACTSRSRVCATLREYLQIEWKVRHRGKHRDFSKDVFKGAVPKVPQQTNYIDCGVYVLQYVEAFFKNPITDYRMPIRSIKEWFTTEEVNRKRYDIMQLLLSIMKEQNIDIPRLNLPFLNLNPFSHYDGDEEEVMEEGEFDDEGVEGEEEPLCEEEEEEDEDEEQFKIEEIFNKTKRFDQLSSEQQQIRLEVQQRMDQSPRSETTPTRIDTSSRIEMGPTLQQLRAESMRPEPVRARVTDQVTICEASSKRKLPLSLKDIRSPRLLSSQTSIEKVKKMRVE